MPASITLSVADFLSKTTHLNAEEIGSLVLLFCHQRTHGAIPNDQTLLERVMRCRCFEVSWQRICDQFELEFQSDDAERPVWVNRELADQLRKQHQVAAKNRLNGKHGGRPKTQTKPKRNPNETQTKPTGLFSRRKTFIPPKIEEVLEYAKSINLEIDAHRFVDFYQSKDWIVGKTKMRDWRAALRRAKDWAAPKQRQITFNNLWNE